MGYIKPMQIVAILTLLLIATLSINSAYSSLQEEFSIQNTGNILTQDNFADTIFFEYGAESGVLQPPFDLVGPHGSGDKSGSYTKVVSSPVRTGTKSVEIYQKRPPKSDAQRRVVIMKTQETGWNKREFYLSWWVYFPSDYAWDGPDANSFGTNLGGWQLWFGPPSNRHQWRTRAIFRLRSGSSRELQFQYSFWEFPDTNNDGDFDEDDTSRFNNNTGVYIDENLNQWIHFQLYLKMTTGSDSVVRAWVDNNLVFEKTTWTSDITAAAPEAYSDWSGENCDWMSSFNPDGYPMFRFKIYDDEDSGEKKMNIDDIVWATEKVPESYRVVDK